MELDELRTLWHRQPPGAEPPLSPQEVRRMQVRPPAGLVERLRGNARLELGLTLLALVLLPAFVYFAPGLLARVLAGLLVPVALVCVYYFYRKLRLLRGLTAVEGDLRAHLTRLAAGMRGLIRFYYRFTLAMVPVSLLSGLLVGLFDPAAGPAPAFSAARVAVLLAVTLPVGGGLYWATARGTRWYLQRLYGRHLDRLESYLRELDEPPPGPARP